MSVIWTNTQFTASALKLLNDGIAAHQLIESRLLSASTWTAATDADPALDTADVALGQPDPEGVMRAERLRWIHLTSAGYTRYDTPEFRAAMSARGIAVTNSSTVYSEP